MQPTDASLSGSNDAKASPSALFLASARLQHDEIIRKFIKRALSHAFARHGIRTLLIDGDVGFSRIDVQLGLLKDPDLGAAPLSEQPIISWTFNVPTLGLDVLARWSRGKATGGFDPHLAVRMVSELQFWRQCYELAFDLASGSHKGCGAR